MTEEEGAAVRWRGEPPRLREPALVAAFVGWPDAGEVASRAMRHLIEHLPARKIAEIDSEEFYVFTDARPVSTSLRSGERQLDWPKSEFFAWRNPATESGVDLVLMLAREPNLRWRTYAANVLTVAMRLGVRRLVTLGGTYDSVVHAYAPVISGAASTPELRRRLEQLDVHGSGYQGPSSIQSALQAVFAERGLPAMSLWGHAPHYVQGVANVKVAAGILYKLGQALEIPFDLSALAAAAVRLDRRVDQLLRQNPELASYVDQLKDRLRAEGHEGSPSDISDLFDDELPVGYLDPEDQPPDSEREMPNPESVVQELEDFLRRQRPADEEDGETGKGNS